MKKTKIICTIGPKTESINMLKKLIKSGMDIARLNLSHGNYEEHSNRIKNIRFLSEKNKKKIPILLDTKGPEIRILTFKDKSKIFLKKNQIFSLSTKLVNGNNNLVSINYFNLHNEIKINSKILIDDGLIKMNVIKIEKNEIICKVINSGYLEENKSLHVMKMKNNISYIREQDIKDLLFCCKYNVDFVAISFVRNSNDVKDVKKFLNNNNGNNILVISKIESKSSLNDIDNIINESDGIMIARGDLGIEIPIENVIIEQKKIIKKCNINNKPVITATHMLESMIYNYNPTRAEVGDIANSIIDGTDSVMLSGESAKGNYPVESVKVMNKVCIKTDKFIKNKKLLSKNDSLYENIINISNILKSKLIVVITNNYNIIYNIRKYNPKQLILNICSNFDTKYENILLLTRGILLHKVKNIDNIDEKFISNINNIIKINKILKKEKYYTLIYNIFSKNNTNSISLIKII